MRFDDATPGRLLLRDGDAVLAEYVYEPSDVQLESPRPYALLRSRAATVGANLVAAVRSDPDPAPAVAANTEASR